MGAIQNADLCAEREVRTTVALVGRRVEQNENLGLGYLRAALERANVSVTVHYVNDAAQMARAIRAILSERPSVVGLSLSAGGAAILALSLGEALSRAGYRGHVTAGGPFATLARDWLLERYAWLDSVVRFAGEEPLVALAERVARGEAVFGVPGVTTREGDGPPAPVLSPLPIDLEPVRDDLPNILGYGAAHIAATRGCRGRCHYCGPAALQTLEREEGLRGGISVGELNAHGIGGVRRRAVDSICDEMAKLWHERRVRYFYFVDEHMLPYREIEALEFIGALRRGLRARGVGALGIGTMLRADRITPNIARAFAEAGLVRAFVGLEIGSKAEEATFGRAAPTARELELLGVFAAEGVATVTNLMLLHPDSTPETVSAGIDLLSRISDGVFEVTQMMVYHGTSLCDRMGREGRLTGNPLRYGYSFADPVMNRFAEIFARLRGEAFWNYSIAYRTHDAHLAIALAKRLYPDRGKANTFARLDAVRHATRSLYVRGYREALDLALQGGGYREADPLVASLRRSSREIERELDGIEALILRESPAHSEWFAPIRAAAASVISFAVASSACGGGNTSPKELDPAANRTPATPSIGPNHSAGTPPDDDAGLVFELPPRDPFEYPYYVDFPPGATGVTCNGPIVEVTTEEIPNLVSSASACFSGFVSVGPELPAPRAGFALSGTSLPMYASLGSCTAPPNAVEQAAADALSCVRVTDSTTPYVDGGANSDVARMAQTIGASSCSSDWLEGFSVSLDETGKVTSVSSSNAVFADCVNKVLDGLSFPCLANWEICTDYVIAE